MENLKFYFTTEFPRNNSKFPRLMLHKDFPDMVEAIVGSIDYESYEEATQACVTFLKSKLAVLNKSDSKYKIFFEKNQFLENDEQDSEWESNEVVKIYIADSSQTVYNSVFKARLFFVKEYSDEFDSDFEAPRLLQ